MAQLNSDAEVLTGIPDPEAEHDELVEEARNVLDKNTLMTYRNIRDFLFGNPFWKVKQTISISDLKENKISIKFLSCRQ